MGNNMKNNWQYFVALMQVNLKTMLALRFAFLLRTLFTVLNHGIYLIIWYAFYDMVPTIGGWTLDHIFLVYGIGCFAWGFATFFCYGIRILPRQIDEGMFDVYLTHPKPVLLNATIMTSHGSGLAEIIVAFILIHWAGVLTLAKLPLILVLLILGASVFVSIQLILGCIGFWVKDMNEANQEFLYNLFLASNRPGSIYTGIYKVIIYTLLPVAFVTFLPVDILLNDDWEALALMLAGSFVIIRLALWLFHRGLTRYESGNRFGAMGA